MEELRIIVIASALAVAGLVLTGLCAAGLGTARAAAKWPSADRPRLGAVPAHIGIGLGVIVSAAAAGVGALLIPLENEFALYGAVAGAALITLVVIAWLATILASKVELSALINSPSPGGQEQQNPTSGMGAQAAPPSPEGLRPYQQAEISYGRPYPGVVEPPTPPHGAIETAPYETETPSMTPQTFASPSINEYEPDEYDTEFDTYVDPIHTTAGEPDQTSTQNAQTIGGEDVSGHVTDMLDDHAIPDDAMPGWVYTDDAEDWYLVALIAGGRRLLRLTDFVIPAPGTVTGELHIAGSIEMTVWPAEVEEDEIEDPETQELAMHGDDPEPDSGPPRAAVESRLQIGNPDDEVPSTNVDEAATSEPGAAPSGKDERDAAAVDEADDTAAGDQVDNPPDDESATGDETGKKDQGKGQGKDAPANMDTPPAAGRHAEVAGDAAAAAGTAAQSQASSGKEAPTQSRKDEKDTTKEPNGPAAVQTRPEDENDATANDDSAAGATPSGPTASGHATQGGAAASGSAAVGTASVGRAMQTPAAQEPGQQHSQEPGRGNQGQDRSPQDVSGADQASAPGQDADAQAQTASRAARPAATPNPHESRATATSPGEAEETEETTYEAGNDGRHRRSRHRRGIQNFGQ